ncbi:caspase family protein [Streptomyces sp. NPDC054874]
MNALRDAEITSDQRLLLMLLGSSWHEKGQWPLWGYVQHYFDTKRRTDAEALLRALPRIGNHTPFGAGYGYTTAVADHRPIDENDTIRLTLAACYAIPDMAGWAGKPFIRVLKHMIDLWDTKPVTPSDPGKAYLSSKKLASQLDLRPPFVTALPDLLSYEPAINTGNGSTTSVGEWKREITRSVLQYRDADTIHDYLDLTCKIVETNAAQYANLTSGRYIGRGVADSNLYAHPSNTLAYMSYEHEPVSPSLLGPAGADAPDNTAEAAGEMQIWRAQEQLEMLRRNGGTLYVPLTQNVTKGTQARGDSTQRALPCWQKGAAVLIGVSDYQKLPPVPSIANNIDSLQEIMISSMGIPSENVFAVKNPESDSEVHEAIDLASEAADPTGGALLVYFAGHGWTDARGRLLLGLVRSSKARSWSALNFNELRNQIADSQIGKRIVILDSCYSGAALDILGQPEDLASAAAIDGTYVLTSANATTPALAPAGERFTTFTGHLVNALRNGIPQGPPVINADTLFRYIERVAKARGIPTPGRQIGGDGDKVEIMANRWG